jgi:hypothetical protein
MAAVAYNLKKLLKWQQRKAETAVMSMKKAIKCLCVDFLMLWLPVKYCNRLHPKFIFC